MGSRSSRRLARGLPVVATKLGPIPELVSEGETGYLVDVGDVDALASRLDRIARRSGDMPSLGPCRRPDRRLVHVGENGEQSFGTSRKSLVRCKR